MFKKVLVVEDIDSINIGLVNTLSSTFSFKIQHANYCDEALLKVKKALLDKAPFDLIITDLSFKADHRPVKIIGGEELIREVKMLDSGIKTIVYSIEDRPYKIKSIIESLEVDGYVIKGRNSSKEVIDAVRSISNNNSYLSSELAYSILTKPAIEIDDYDLLLIQELAQGFSQQEIERHFKEKDISPSSLSSIEKRINNLKDYFMAKNVPHLIAIVKDMGLC